MGWFEFGFSFVSCLLLQCEVFYGAGMLTVLLNQIGDVASLMSLLEYLILVVEVLFIILSFYQVLLKWS